MKICIVLTPHSFTLTAEQREGKDPYIIRALELVTKTRNEDYLNKYLRFLLLDGYAPFVGHPIYSSVLDTEKEGADIGREAEIAIFNALGPCDVFVGDRYGIYPEMGMKLEWLQKWSVGSRFLYESKGEIPFAKEKCVL